MNEPASWKWIDREVLLTLHDESLAEHGGGVGIRDEGLLDSALARPLNTLAYGQPSVAELVAAYGFGLAKNRPFVDGNKRAAFLAVGLFLYLNGYRLSATQADATRAVLALAASEIGEAQFAQWIHDNMRSA